MITYKLSAKNDVPALCIEAIDIVKCIGVDWNWHTLSKITAPSIRSFFGELHRALCAIDAPAGDNQDTDEYEQDIIMQNICCRSEYCKGDSEYEYPSADFVVCPVVLVSTYLLVRN